MDMRKLAHHNEQVKGKRSRKTSENQGLMSKKSSRKPEAALKVVYISTPMKVTTCASKFRALVQELTGRESDVVSIMESSGGKDTWMVHDDDDRKALLMNSTTSDEKSVPSVSSSEEFVVEQFDGVFVRGHDCSNFDLPDHSSLIFDQYFHHLDVLGSY